MNKLDKLFDIVSSYSRRLRRKFPEEDFDNQWHILSLHLDKYPKAFSEWYKEVKPNGVLYTALIDKIMNLPEKYITGRGETELIDNNHYLISMYRPADREPTLTNLMSVAYNYGLLSAHLRQHDFPEGIVRTLKNLKGYQPINFLSTADSRMLDEFITDEMLKDITNFCKLKLKALMMSKICRTSDSDSDTDKSD